jgi:hypothetical protein
MARFLLKKILIGLVVSIVSILLSGCNINIFQPRPRMGTLPTPPPGPRFSDPNHLGRHSYYLNPFESDGILYTNRGGTIDVSHLRWNADYTRYLTKKTYNTLMKKGKGYSFNVTWERSTHRIRFIYPDNWDSLSKIEKEKIAKEIAFEVGPYITFEATIWHEIVTWFGTRFAGFEPEFNSAFSWEDMYSNALGIKIALEAIQDPNHSYDTAMTIGINREFKRLGVRSRKDAINATEKMRGKWYKGYLNVIMLRRNMDVGDSGFVSPILIPGICETAVPEKMPAPKLSVLSKYGFTLKYDISPNVWESGKIYKVVFSDGKRGRIEPMKHYPILMDYIKKEAVEKYGYEVN